MKIMVYISINYIKFVELTNYKGKKLKISMIKRIFNISELLKPSKVLVIYGARRVGKTTLLNDFLSGTHLKYKLESGDNIRLQNLFNKQDFNEILGFVEGYELLAIDEAQQINKIGLGLKILVDNKPELNIIVTGSSSFDLSQQIGEPLTGRKRTVTLFSLSQQELVSKFNKYELKKQLENFLIFGSYPEIINTDSRKEKIEILNELVNSYLLKDVFAYERIRGPQQILDLLKLLSFQVGSEVSINELASILKIDAKTVGRYLDILEKAFVIKRFGAYSGNMRNEVTGKSKYYFLDNGIRNGVILQFNELQNRDDQGKLFENFIMMERLKYLCNNNVYRNLYFWRTYQKQEIDLIEEGDGVISGHEIKWGTKNNIKIPSAWKTSYPESKVDFITPDNYLNYLT